MFNPRDFLQICCTCSGPDRSEAEYRTAVSRALYGVFLWAREELEARGEHVKVSARAQGPLEHSKVRQRFKEGKFRHDGVSQRLSGLYRLRYDGDYNLDTSVGQSHVKQALQYVKYIERQFDENLFSRPPHGNQPRAQQPR